MYHELLMLVYRDICPTVTLWVLLCECSIRVYLFTDSESSLIVLLTIRRKTLEGANIGEFGENYPITKFSITNVLPNVKY